jgi:hypothetical protein
MPHADYSSSYSTGRPSHDDEPGIQPSDSDESLLAIVTPSVGASEMWTGKNLDGTAHIQAAILQRQQPLLSVAGDAHVLS